MAGWLGSYGGEDSTSDISRGKPDEYTTFFDLTTMNSDSKQDSGPVLSGLVDF